ncbi:hypothetical protein PGTUg99_003964 [Puccinia graminis f. sp. tritici]|uniref:DUF6589 domain-containing protein n=1 Tax=Puccinia graminis f. sp. tritici TaxID=56615 RepID=A0A5B0QZW2_PUCGR|nr:hypothetical protein PGTUg99_003964 [Puccinia graminis f. sp. tritici]
MACTYHSPHPKSAELSRRHTSDRLAKGLTIGKQLYLDNNHIIDSQDKIEADCLERFKKSNFTEVDHMPFLFDLIFVKLKKQPINTNDPAGIDSEDSNDEADPVPETDLQGDGMDPGDDFDRKTAHRALNYLSHEAKERISAKIKQSPASGLAPFLCIDNLDFEERIHTKSLGHSTHMFHGTWGYIHHPSPELIASVPSVDLTPEAYHEAMSKTSTVDVQSRMLLATAQEEVQWEMVLKSQITEALLEHVASPSDSMVSLNTKPPVIKQISSNPPDITMLKLMIASDNSAQGAVDGDLASCTNVTSLRTQRSPSAHSKQSLVNVLTILGGAHTMWNISQAIYSKHFGDSSDSRDSGAWRFLDALGIPSHKMLEKKDFTLMIKNIEKIHKATLVYCIKVVMGTDSSSLTEELPRMSSARISEVVNETYIRFFSAEAKLDATLQTSPKLYNTILRLADFATIAEGDAAMKAGNIGCVMNVWKRWAVIAQGIKKLTQYSIQLPQMILLLNEILPSGLAHIIKHSMFVAPHGRQKHFVAKDQFLESQNYWLKHFFNNTGRGTNIKRLKDSYSLNVPLLQGLVRGLVADSGRETIHQSHKNRINLKSLNNCLRMCRENNICYISAKLDEYIPKKVEDFYALGIIKMKKLFLQKGRPSNKPRPPAIKIWNTHTITDDQLDEASNDSDVSVDGDDEPDATEDEHDSNSESEEDGNTDGENGSDE